MAAPRERREDNDYRDYKKTAMVDDYLSDREQEEALLNWWRENWRWIIGGIALGLVLLVGYFQWQAYQDRRGVAASAQYEKVREAAEQGDLDRAQEALAALAKDYGSTPYAQQGRLLVAKLHAEAGKFDEAAALLAEVSDKSKDDELAAVAKLRLARVLMQQGKHDEVIALLKVDKLGAFAAQAREIRGDAYVAKGDQSAARAEYAAALADPSAMIDRTIVEMKLQDLGGSGSDAKAQGQS
jgi:predicted negative regulator of RcsB-dependent stress response